jgi:hypothetical protein
MLDRHPGNDLDLALGIGAVFKFQKYLVLDLRVPGKVEIAGLDHRTGRRHRIPAALHFDGVEIRPVGHVVIAVALAFDEITGREIDEPIGTSSNGL